MRYWLDYIMITPSYPPRVGGVEKHVFEVHLALKRMGLRGEIVVFKEPPAGTENTEDVIWIPFRRLWGWVPKTARLRVTLKLANLFRKEKPKVIHFHDGTIYAFVSLLRFCGLLERTYMTFHGWEGVYPPAPQAISKRQRIANTVQGSIAIGDFIEKWYGTRSDIVNYGGVDVGRYGSLKTADHDPNVLRIGYFGRLEPDTGILEVVETVQKCGNKSDKKVRLDIYGEGSLRDKLLSIMKKNQLTDITILPPVRDTSSILAKYKIVVASGYLTILEALCAERIVFAQYHNALREDYLRMHPAASSMFICKSVDDFSAGISLCLSDPEGVIVKCRVGWDWAKKQSWESVAIMYANLWNLKV